MTKGERATTVYELAPERPEPKPTRPRPPRPRRRLPRPESAERRVSRSFAVSLGVHALVVLLLALLLLTLPDQAPDPAELVRYSWETPLHDVEPEATEGRHERAPEPGERSTDDQRSVTGDETTSGATSLASGDARDETRKRDPVGIANVPAGALLAARTAGREALLRSGGGDAETEGALRLALGWLRRHQAADGTWSPRDFSERCRSSPPCTHTGEAREAVAGVTAIALLPFLGAGHTHRDGEYAGTVAAGIDALLRRERRRHGAHTGSWGTGEHAIYEQAAALLVLAEAYGLTGDERLRAPIERGVAHLGDVQARGGGWRYRPLDRAADASVTGWVAFALVAVRRDGLEVPPLLLQRARSVLRSRTRASDGRVGYLARGSGSDALLGVGAFGLHAIGDPRDAKLVAAIRKRLVCTPPRWDESPLPGFHRGDPLHWAYGSLAAFQGSDVEWQSWHERMRPLLLGRQERKGCAAGSWRPSGTTGKSGGRVVQTALAALCLEVYYRYPRVRIEPR